MRAEHLLLCLEGTSDSDLALLRDSEENAIAYSYRLLLELLAGWKQRKTH